MVEITAVLRDIILIAFIVLLAALAVFGYIRLNKIITKIDSLVENSQKLIWIKQLKLQKKQLKLLLIK